MRPRSDKQRANQQADKLRADRYQTLTACIWAVKYHDLMVTGRTEAAQAAMNELASERVLGPEFAASLKAFSQTLEIKR